MSTNTKEKKEKKNSDKPQAAKFDVARLLLEKHREQTRAEIMSSFDFEKVEKVMRFLKWKVAEPNSAPDIPDKWKLIDMANELIHECWDSFDNGEPEADEYTVHTGPFRVWWCECDEGVFGDLSFVVENWRAEPMERADGTPY